MYQYFKDRASRMQSENLLSGFAEAQPIFERSSMNTCLQGFCPFDNAKLGIKKRRRK